MNILTRERILYLLKGAEQGMLHGDYMPNILEREFLCKFALERDTWRAEALAAREVLSSCDISHSYVTELERGNYDNALKATDEAGLK